MLLGGALAFIPERITMKGAFVHVEEIALQILSCLQLVCGGAAFGNNGTGPAWWLRSGVCKGRGRRRDGAAAAPGARGGWHLIGQPPPKP